MANNLPRRDFFSETNWLRNTVSRDTETKICKHLENDSVAWELKHGYRKNTTEQRNCKTWWLPSRSRVNYKRSWFLHSGAAWTLCGGGVEYFHRLPASCRRRRKGKSRIWESKIWSRVPRTRSREWMRWRGPAAIVNDRPIVSSGRMLYKDYTRRCSIEKRILSVSLKGLGAKTNWLAVNRQS
jgi:hypothetical protein